MSDNELLHEVRQTLSGVHMDRPVATIMRRGRNRRRVRTLAGVAGGGLVVLVGAALALPTLTGATAAPSGTVSAHGGVGTSDTPRVELAAWTVDVLPDTTVRVTLRRADFADVSALEKELSDAGVPAFVRSDSQCVVHGATTAAGSNIVTAKTADDLGNWPLVYTIHPAAIPEGAHLILTAYPQLKTNPTMPVPNNVDLAAAGTTVTCNK
jgi:hypothetical protein